MVPRVAAIHSAKVRCFCSKTGTSAPASRAAPPWAISLAIWICAASGSMSGNNRVPSSAAGSILRVSVYAAALSRIAARLLNARVQVGTVAVYMVRDIGSGRLACCGELPQYVLQDPAMLVVVEFLRGIDAQARLELRGLTAIGLGDDFDEFRRAAVEPRDFKGFLAGEPEAVRILTFLELQGQYAHADQVGAVNALEALGDHCLDSQQHRALGRPVARAAGTVFFPGENHQRRTRRLVFDRRVENGHLLAAGDVQGHAAFRARQQEVAQPDVGKGAAHHHFVVAAAPLPTSGCA